MENITRTKLNNRHKIVYLTHNGKHIQAFYSENKSFSLDYIKNVLDHWLLYNPIEDGNSRS